MIQLQPGSLERAKGIEPSYAAWEAAVLPLNYARAARYLAQVFPVRLGTQGAPRPPGTPDFAQPAATPVSRAASLTQL